jgi:hypothetical protein
MRFATILTILNNLKLDNAKSGKIGSRSRKKKGENVEGEHKTKRGKERKN